MSINSTRSWRLGWGVAGRGRFLVSPRYQISALMGLLSRSFNGSVAGVWSLKQRNAAKSLNAANAALLLRAESWQVRSEISLFPAEFRYLSLSLSPLNFWLKIISHYRLRLSPRYTLVWKRCQLFGIVLHQSSRIRPSTSYSSLSENYYVLKSEPIIALSCKEAYSNFSKIEIDILRDYS